MLICEKLSCEEAIYYTPICVALIFVTQFCGIPLCGKLIGGMKNADLRKAIMRRSDLLYAGLRGADIRNTVL
jgi:hypothetical protein